MTDQEFKNLLESEQVLYGKGAPSSAQGKELDLYIDTDTRKFYRKYLGSWTCNADLVLGPLFTTGNMSWDQLKVDASLAAFFEIVTESDGDRVFKLKPPANGGNGRTYYLGETNGVADWRDPAADFGAWLENLKNKPNGVPGLDDKGKLDPGKVFPDSYQKDKNGGIAGLDESGKLKKEQIPDLSDLYADKNAGNLNNGDVKAWQDRLGLGNDTLHDMEAKEGYTQFPNGLILEWGITTKGKDETIFNITWPIAFTQVFSIVHAPQYISGTGGGELSSFLTSYNLTHGTFTLERSAGTNEETQDEGAVHWMALGK